MYVIAKPFDIDDRGARIRQSALGAPKIGTARA
jgi:hypothetical protein